MYALRLWIPVTMFILLLIYFGVSFYIADKLTVIIPNPVTIQPASISPAYEEVTFQTPDNIMLKGWLFSGQSNKLVIMIAGHGQNRENPEYDSVHIAKDVITHGYSVLLYDARGNGISQKTRAGFGFGTGNDILGAVSFAKNKGYDEKRIAIIADSMGATATTLLADKLSRIGAIIVDSPAARLEPIVSSAMWREKHIPYVFHPGIYFLAKHIFGVDIPGVRPINTLAFVPQRVFLFLHGENDATIPVENSRLLLSKANAASRLVIFPNAGHVQTYKTNPSLYKQEVFDFLTRNLTL